MFERTYPFLKRSQSGFTLVELLLVTVIVGIIIAVIVPRAWRANIEAKYGLLRQAATELVSWGTTWAERNQESQGEGDSCVLNDYVDTLVGYTGNNVNTNWVAVTDNLISGCRSASGTGIASSVADIMPQEKQPRNPFNGLSYLNQANNGSSLQSGLLYLAKPTLVDSNGYWNYYFVYTGTDSTSVTDWHAGMGTGGHPPPLANLRNGIFMARLQP